MNKNEAAVRAIAEQVHKKHGTAYYVGGVVRDRLLGIPVNDYDLELYDINPSTLFSILNDLGFSFDEVGAKFGIVKLKDYDIDLSFPRTELKTGCRHTDFKTTLCPHLSPEKAAQRRDFTVNAMMQNVLTDEILDFFGGRNDLNEKVLRPVNSATFCEDELRVLRAARFSARLHFSLSEELIHLCKHISLSDLPKERIENELKLALTTTDNPSEFFRSLDILGHSELFPELYCLKDIPQSPRWHAEGSAYEHTLLVLDAAATMRDNAKNPYHFLLAALVHDFGKSITTTIENEGIRSIGHETSGDEIIRTFFNRFSSNKSTLSYILNMTHLHMKPLQLSATQAGVAATNRLFFDSICPEELILLALADRKGQLPIRTTDEDEKFLNERLKHFRDKMLLPRVTGGDLIAAGITPGEEYKELLSRADDLFLREHGREEILQIILSNR